MNNIATPTGCVAATTIAMAGPATFQNARPMEEIMHQGIDGDHRFANVKPGGTVSRSAKEEGGQAHLKDLI